MDILQQQYSSNNKKKPNKAKKKILGLLIFFIILLIITIVCMYLFKDLKIKKSLSLVVNNANIQIENNMIAEANEKTYISLPKISKIIGYNYTRGGYLEYSEDVNKCYLESKNQVVNFEAEKNIIFKTAKNSKTDYQYFELENNIVAINGELYIAVEDLNVGLNVVCEYYEEDNKIDINTLDAVIELNKAKFEGKSITISNQTFKNMQAISYGMFVVTGENGKMGVVDKNMQTIIGNRYTTIEFDEFSQRYIVSDNNKYGVISIEGDSIIDLKFQDIEIINYSPLIYKVKFENKYAILNKDGKALTKVEYEGFGSNGNTDEERVVVIKNIDNSKRDGIVAYKNGRYGLINIENGEIILDFTAEKIYCKLEDNDKIYYVQSNNSQIKLEEYLKHANTTVVELNNE